MNKKEAYFQFWKIRRIWEIGSIYLWKADVKSSSKSTISNWRGSVWLKRTNKLESSIKKPNRLSTMRGRKKNTLSWFLNTSRSLSSCWKERKKSFSWTKHLQTCGIKEARFGNRRILFYPWLFRNPEIEEKVLQSLVESACKWTRCIFNWSKQQTK